MALSDIAFASGLSSLMIVLIGWVLGLYLLNKYRSNPDTNTLALAIVLISIGSVWLSISVNFLIALSGSTDYLDGLSYMLLIGWLPGVTGITLGYMFVSIVKEEYLKPTMIIFGLFLVLDIVVMYILVPFELLGMNVASVISFADSPADALPDAGPAGVWRILSIISIVIMIIIAIFFLITALRTDIKRVRARAGLLGLGLFLTTILLVFDSLVTPNELVLLLIVRIGVMIGLIVMSMGITLPKFLFKDLD